MQTIHYICIILSSLLALSEALGWIKPDSGSVSKVIVQILQAAFKAGEK